MRGFDVICRFLTSYALYGYNSSVVVLLKSEEIMEQFSPSEFLFDMHYCTARSSPGGAKEGSLGWSEMQPQVDMIEKTKAPTGRHSFHCVAPLGLQTYAPMILGFRPQTDFTPGYCISSLRDFYGRNSFCETSRPSGIFGVETPSVKSEWYDEYI